MARLRSCSPARTPRIPTLCATLCVVLSFAPPPAVQQPPDETLPDRLALAKWLIISQKKLKTEGTQVLILFTLSEKAIHHSLFQKISRHVESRAAGTDHQLSAAMRLH